MPTPQANGASKNRNEAQATVVEQDEPIKNNEIIIKEEDKKR